MKRLIAKRKLKRSCSKCNAVISKGEVYYKERHVSIEEGFGNKIFYSIEFVTCAKCQYKQEQHNKRYALFAEKCKHPAWAIETMYRYIPGESVKEPDYDRCLLCGKTVI